MSLQRKPNENIRIENCRLLIHMILKKNIAVFLGQKKLILKHNLVQVFQLDCAKESIV